VCCPRAPIGLTTWTIAPMSATAYEPTRGGRDFPDRPKRHTCALPQEVTGASAAREIQMTLDNQALAPAWSATTTIAPQAAGILSSTAKARVWHTTAVSMPPPSTSSSAANRPMRSPGTGLGDPFPRLVGALDRSRPVMLIEANAAIGHSGVAMIQLAAVSSGSSGSSRRLWLAYRRSHSFMASSVDAKLPRSCRSTSRNSERQNFHRPK